VYSISVEGRFSAVHRVRLLDGTVEPPHRHEWIVRAYFARAKLDQLGMVVDFSAAQSGLRSVTGRLDHKDLNRCEELTGQNPTAEVVARYVFQSLMDAGFSTVSRVEVTEAPGCLAAFEPA
jgi:6-pyruvoyltetrahydropterin/6-carboxytetrahydropterin synthase